MVIFMWFINWVLLGLLYLKSAAVDLLLLFLIKTVLALEQQKCS